MVKRRRSEIRRVYLEYVRRYGPLYGISHFCQDYPGVTLAYLKALLEENEGDGRGRLPVSRRGA